MTDPVRVEAVSWSAGQSALAAIRREVFMDEQQVPEELEWDGLDDDAVHVLASSGDAPIGCGRMLADGHIGRMAVRRPYRARGIGATLLAVLIAIARSHGHDRVFLDAQVSAIGFYERFGFTAHGPEFMDAGIPHRHMDRHLTPSG